MFIKVKFQNTYIVTLFTVRFVQSSGLFRIWFISQYFFTTELYGQELHKSSLMFNFFPENFCFFNHNVHEDDFYIISMSTLILHSSLLIMTYCWQNLLLKNVCNEKKGIRCQYWTS